LPETQLEYMYKYGYMLPPEFIDLASDIETYTKSRNSRNEAIIGYRVKEGADSNAVMDVIDDPLVAIILGREFLRDGLTFVQKHFPAELQNLIDRMSGTPERIRAMEEHLTRPLNGADVKATLFLGPSGASRFLAANADPEKANHRALDYASRRTVAANPHIFYKDGNEKEVPRSVSELYGLFTGMMGNDPLPRDLKRREDSIVLAQIAPEAADHIPG